MSDKTKQPLTEEQRKILDAIPIIANWQQRAERAESALADCKRTYGQTAEDCVDLTKKLNQSEAACAEMRSFIVTYTTHASVFEQQNEARDRVLSTDCGKGWMSPEKAKELREGWQATKIAYAEDVEQYAAALTDQKQKLKLAVEALARVPCNCSSLRIGSNLHDRDCAKLSAQQTLSQLKGQ